MTLNKLLEIYNFTNSRIVFPLDPDGDGCVYVTVELDKALQRDELRRKYGDGFDTSDEIFGIQLGLSGCANIEIEYGEERYFLKKVDDCEKWDRCEERLRAFDGSVRTVSLDISDAGGFVAVLEIPTEGETAVAGRISFKAKNAKANEFYYLPDPWGDDIEARLTNEGFSQYHDGSLNSAEYCDGVLTACFFRPYWYHGDSFKHNIRVRFYGVSELEVYDWDKDEMVPYYFGCFEGEKCPKYINGFSASDGKIEFDECIRFKCESCEVLEEFDD